MTWLTWAVGVFLLAIYFINMAGYAFGIQKANTADLVRKMWGYFIINGIVFIGVAYLMNQALN